VLVYVHRVSGPPAVVLVQRMPYASESGFTLRDAPRPFGNKTHFWCESDIAPATNGRFQLRVAQWGFEIFFFFFPGLQQEGQGWVVGDGKPATQ